MARVAPEKRRFSISCHESLLTGEITKENVMEDFDKIKVYVYCDSRYSGNYVYEFNGGILRLKFKPFYVGCAKGNGFLRHLAGKRSSEYVQKRIRKIREEELEPIIKILRIYESKKKARKLEEILIIGIGRQDLKTGPLLNRSDGPGCKNSPRAEKASRRRMKKMWKNFEFRKNVSAGVSKATKKRWKTDTKGKRELSERSREKNLKNWQDSKYRKKMIEVLKKNQEFIKDKKLNLGENNSSAKLTERKVLEIRKLREKGWLIIDLVKNFDVSKSTIKRIIYRIHWKHI